MLLDRFLLFEFDSFSLWLSSAITSHPPSSSDADSLFLSNITILVSDLTAPDIDCFCCLASPLVVCFSMTSMLDASPPLAILEPAACEIAAWWS